MKLFMQLNLVASMASEVIRGQKLKDRIFTYFEELRKSFVWLCVDPENFGSSKPFFMKLCMQFTRKARFAR